MNPHAGARPIDARTGPLPARHLVAGARRAPFQMGRNLLSRFVFSACRGIAVHGQGAIQMAVNKPTGDNARKGAVKKRSQTKTTMGGATTWTKRDKESGEFLAVKKAKKTAAKKAVPTKAAAARKKTTVAKKFKGVRREKGSQ